MIASLCPWRSDTSTPRKTSSSPKLLRSCSMPSSGVAVGGAIIGPGPAPAGGRVPRVRRAGEATLLRAALAERRVAPALGPVDADAGILRRRGEPEAVAEAVLLRHLQVLALLPHLGDRLVDAFLQLGRGLAQSED